MPRLPIIEAQQGIRGQQLPVAGPDFFGAGIGRQLEQSAGVFEKIQFGYDSVEGAKLIAEGSAGLRSVLVDAKIKATDPEQYKEMTERGIAEVYGATLERAPNERVLRGVTAGLANDKAFAEKNAQFGYFEKQRDVAVGDYEKAKGQILQSLAVAGSQANRNELQVMFGDLVGRLKASNYLDSVQAEKEIRGFARDQEQARASYMLQTNPEGFQAALKAGEFPGLDPYVWDQRANEVIREQQQRVKEAEKLRVDAVNQGLLVDMERTPPNGMTALRENILNRKDLPFDVQRWWVDRISNRIEDQQRQVERAEDRRERAADRAERQVERADRLADRAWTRSDGAVLGSVMSGILANPEQWTQERILAKMGKGLSVPHTLQAVEMLTKTVKQLNALPRGSEPLANAIKSLDFYRDQKVFIPQDKRGAFTPEDLLQNDQKMQDVMDKLIQRAKGGEDPQRVLSELMQPYYEEEVKGWFDWATGRDPAKEQGERAEARQRLARQGLAVTEENIQRAIQVMRKRTTQPTGPRQTGMGVMP